MRHNRAGKTCQIRIFPSGIILQGTEGQTIMEVLLESNIPVRSDCSGLGICQKCMVWVRPVSNSYLPIEAEPTISLKRQEVGWFECLACQTKVQGNIIVMLPIVGSKDDEVLPKVMASGSFPSLPYVTRITIHRDQCIKSYQAGFNSDILSRIKREVDSTLCRSFKVTDTDVLRRLSKPVAEDGKMTLVVHDECGFTAVLDGVKNRSSGLAVDIGTTSIAAYLCDFNTGTILASAGVLNSQTQFGADVMSRIAFACKEPTGFEKLNLSIVQNINDLLHICVDRAGIYIEDIDEMAVVGNTTMQHIFSGLHPHSLGRAPYTPFLYSSLNMRASDLGCKINPGTNVYIFPVVSGFVGGDSLGCILLDRTYARDEVTLIMDIGTNGELILGNKNELWATSCATGPAFEGANISCGMRASTGAIHSITIDPSNFNIIFNFFGEKEDNLPRGICGSGIIDAVSAMLQAGIIDSRGVLYPGSKNQQCSNHVGKPNVVIVPADNSYSGREIFITAKDIRNVQSAKAALRSGIEILKHRSGFTHIDRMVLTGAFGATFNLASASIIGLIPPEVNLNRLEVIPNAAGMGAICALLNKERRQEMEALKIKAVDLASDPYFADSFVDMLTFSRLKMSI